MKRILAEWHGYTVELNKLSAFPGRVNVTTTDGTKPFTRYFYGFGVGDDNTGLVFVDSLENIRVVEDVQDPFEPCDPPADEPEYDPALEWLQVTGQMRRGE